MPASANIWHFTAAGRAALADGANQGMREVRFTKMAIGTGSGSGGSADDAIAALRTQNGASVAVGGSTMVQGRVALRATFTRAARVDVTEVGVFARIGAAGAEFLAAYWSDDGRVAVSVAQEPTVIAGVVDLQSAAAAVAVTLEPALTLNPPAARFVDLTDTDEALLAGRFLQVDAAAKTLGQKTAAEVLSALLAGLPAERYVRTRVAEGVRSFEVLTAAELAAALEGLLVMRQVATMQSAQVAVGAGWTDSGLEATLTVAAGRKVTVIADVSVQNGTGTYEMRVVRGAHVVATADDIASTAGYPPMQLAATDTPPAGEHTYKVQARAISNPTIARLHTSRVSRLIVTEVRA